MTHWSNRFLELATFISSWSKDPSTKVGAVITKENRIISMGYNGLPWKIYDLPERLNNRETKLLLTLHAEVNAILFAKQDLKNCRLYCTHPPCTQCTALIIQSGICAVIWKEPTKEFLSRWENQVELTANILKEAKIQIHSESY